ncbi:hypothetical protein CXB51_024456 [Gossypium anomalum]|uniref:HVA22-like protein n=1 Tax=Gossypium anomalum TaxID=47600 RepID=A0A8J5Z6D9_9ROSI|nr:hypothetical protein CXB51_024456 [Gossypium anomalum]
MGVLTVIAKRLDAIIGPGVMLLYPLVPLWPYMKLVLCMWLVLPIFNGAAYIYEKHIRKYIKFGGFVGSNYSEDQKKILQMISLDARKYVAEYVDKHGWPAFERIIKAAEKEAKKP